MRLIGIVALSLIATSQLTGADLLTGVSAFQKGDYATALRELRPLAEKGDAAAQAMLGLIYYQGKGVQQDYREALSWYFRAADRGDTSAQLALGSMYSQGQGVEQDLVLGYMRFSLCVDDPDVGANCRKNRDGASRLLTPAEIAEGQRLARAWKPGTPKGSGISAQAGTPITNSASLPIGEYRLGVLIQGVNGLTEFSRAQYAVIGRMFDGESDYNAPSVEFLKHRWNVSLGTVAGKVYKIGLYFNPDGKDMVGALEDVRQYCQQHLGKPSEQHDSTFIWDTADGSVMLELVGTEIFHQINLFETSRAMSGFTLKR